MHWSELSKRYETRRQPHFRNRAEEGLVVDDRSLRRPSEYVERKLTSLLDRSNGRFRPTLLADDME